MTRTTKQVSATVVRGADFSWVKARASCSIASVYERVRVQVKRDVDERRELRTEKECELVNFSVNSDGDSFTVVRAEQASHKSITFVKTASGIMVIDQQDKTIIEGTLTLDNDGNCRMRTALGDLELWQFRRSALEDLFF